MGIRAGIDKEFEDAAYLHGVISGIGTSHPYTLLTFASSSRIMEMKSSFE